MNEVIERNKYVMFLFEKGKLYFHRDHYKYLDPEDAPKVLLGTYTVVPKNSRPSNRIPGAKLLYCSNKLD